MGRPSLLGDSRVHPGYPHSFKEQPLSTEITSVEPRKKASLPRVLVASPNPEFSLACYAELSARNFMVFTAASAEQARVRATETAPDAIIVDDDPPGLAGIALAMRLNAASAAPIIFMSACTERAHVAQALSAGVHIYLAKPIHLALVTPVLQSALHRIATQGDLNPRDGQCVVMDKSRSVAVATGLLMQRFSLRESEAYRRLCEYARSEGLKVGDSAARLIAIAEASNMLFSAIVKSTEFEAAEDYRGGAEAGLRGGRLV